jgi:3alpha(or 20beta)-hydroxysteroid dehydrogenase
VALVTGSASGIGEATAQTFAREGATVVVSDIRDEFGQSVAAAIGDAASYIHLDASDRGSWETVVDEVETRFGGLDVLVNNAGTGTGGGILAETLSEHRRVMDPNVTGLWLGFAPRFPPWSGAAAVRSSTFPRSTG